MMLAFSLPARLGGAQHTYSRSKQWTWCCPQWLGGRLIAFLVRKYLEPGAAEDAVRLRRALLRAGAIVEEAEGRQIANRAALLQLDQLRRDMCRGAYVLDVDALRRRAGDSRQRHATARTFSRLRLGTEGGLSVVVESLEAELSDMRELVVLLSGCPRVARQPYSAYLLMESCMFGRQMEKEQIVSFLLRPSQDLDVLPPSSALTSWAGAHAGLGTAPPLRLRAPRREELWYFFRALAFGAADPEERPELLRVAMALFACIHDPAAFAAAGLIAASLRADLSARSWRRVLAMFAGATDWRGVFLCRPVKDAPGVPCAFRDRRKSTGAATARSELPGVTMLDLVTGGAVLPLPGGGTRFDVLVWRSRIPPYASYVATCDVGRARQVVAVEKKRAHKRRGHQQGEERDELAEMTSYESR
ncbi:disease resistance protein RGA2-like [Panicum miliaceum]|uniref:Disease resistance protein RGA2-like n=1 Tax=Panicum miliaceum TaxID=4540 RepID=A0A3L6SLF1_PANMI|nr:disease resistance protein RGA2-like [Panicum miliaceum]